MKKRWLQGVIIAAVVCASLAGCKKTAQEAPSAQTEGAGFMESGTAAKKEEEAAKASVPSSGEESMPSAQEESAGIQEEYLFPESNTRLLTGEELGQLSPEQLRFARNEIYARHGRMFTSPELQAYFDSKSWYEGTVKPEDFSENLLNGFEKENIELIKAREDMGDILDEAGRYRVIMEENKNGIFGTGGLLKYGRIDAAMSDGYTGFLPLLKDKGSYYQAPDQSIAVPVYYQWDFIKNVSPGDELTITFGWDDESVYTVTEVLQEHGKEARVISVFSSRDQWEIPMVFTDAFGNGKYVLAYVDEISDDSYVIWNSDDISCACRILYRGDFYLSKDCIIDVGGEEFSVKGQWEYNMDKNSFGGAIYGDIMEIDANGLITRIRQQIAG